jgi:hypothetical protein
VRKYFPNQNPEKCGLNIQVEQWAHIEIALRKTRKQKKHISVTSAQNVTYYLTVAFVLEFIFSS